MMRKLLFFAIAAFSLNSTSVSGQCPTPSILGITCTDAITGWVSYTCCLDGTYYIEFGPVGFTPGTNVNPGVGGTVIQSNLAHGTTEVQFLIPATQVDCYVRLQCSNLSWTPNSAPYTYTLNGPVQPIQLPVHRPDSMFVIGFNSVWWLPANIQNTCTVVPTGQEFRYRFNSPDTSYYSVAILAFPSVPIPNFGMKTLDGITIPSSYSCETIDFYETNVGGSHNRYTYNFGPLNKGTAYDLIFDATDVTVHDVSVTVSCPRPESVTVSNITPASVDLSWNCLCSDSIILEYGLPGFTPGTGNIAGASGTLIAPVSSPYTLTGLTTFTKYDVYFRSACGGYYSPNNKITIKTAKDCALAPAVTCGSLMTFNYSGNTAQRGAWDLNSCGDVDSSEEKIYAFTPSVSGSYSLYVYNLTASNNGYFYEARFYYKEASTGCNEIGWNCFASLSQNPPAFTPQTLTFGPLTAGTTYYIAIDGNSFGSSRSYNYFFELECANVCNNPVLTSATNITINSAQINVACATCFTNGMIEYGPSGFTPGTGLTPGPGGTVITGVTFPYILSGLSTFVTYDVYARSDCSAGGLGFSINSGPVSFTPCSTAPTAITTTNNVNSICPGDSITLYRQGGQLPAGGTFNWYSGTCGNLYEGTGDSIRVSPSSNTTYFVRSEASCGVSPCANKTINVMSPLPVITGDNTICTGTSTILGVTGAWQSYLWTTGATSSTINVSTPGTYTVTVTMTTSPFCVADTSILVTQSPPVMVNIFGTTTFCNGSSTTLSPGAGYAGYMWSTGATTASIVASAAGPYWVVVTDANGCTGSDTVMVSVNPNPTPVITGDNDICDGQTTVLNAGGPYSSYIWSIGTTTQTITVGTAGTYTVTVVDVNGCSGTNSITVTVYPNPTPVITGNPSVCTGSTTLSSSPAVTYYWNTAATTPSINVTTAGWYFVTVTDVNGCTGTDSVLVTGGTTVNITAMGPTIFCQGDSVQLSSTPGMNFYAWYKNGLQISGAVNQNYYAKTTGSYYCIGTDNAGCIDTSNAILVLVPCITNPGPPSIGKSTPPEETAELIVYPNPSNGDFILEISCTLNQSGIEIFDATGRTVMATLTEDRDGRYRISSLSEGVYTIVVYCNNRTLTRQVVRLGN